MSEDQRLKNENRIKEINAKFDESYSAFNALYTKVKRSNEFYSGLQWNPVDAKRSRDKNIPPLTYNFVKKNVDVVVGIQVQNRSALKALPEESGDNITTSIASILMHHAMRKGNGYRAGSEAFKMAGTGGIAYLSPYIDFRKDPICGDVRIVCDSALDIFPDPSFREIDMSDCTYIVKRKVISKAMAMQAYPMFAQQIKESKSDYRSDYFVMEESGLKDKCVVKELWERVYVPMVTVGVDEPDTGEQIITMTEEEFEREDKLESVEVLRQLPTYAERRHGKYVLRLAISINNEILVFDGDSPYKGDYFPFVPIFCFYNRFMDRWEYRILSLVDPLKDPQAEYNKSKANMMHYMLSSIHSGWVLPKGAIDDVRVLTKGMSAPVVQYNPTKDGKDIRRIEPPSLPGMFMNWANDSFNDIMRIGLNAESLGFNSGAESAKAIKMKNLQGMATIGEFPDNFQSSMIQLGKIILKMIYQFYDLNKIKRILGKDYEWITEEHLLQIDQMDYDVEVDDTTYSPVQRMYRLEQKTALLQYGLEGFSKEDFYDDLEIDAAERVKMEQRKIELEQQKAQQAQMQAQTQAQVMASKAGVDKAKADNLNAQTQLMGTKTLENIYNLTGAQPGSLSSAGSLAQNGELSQQNSEQPVMPEGGM